MQQETPITNKQERLDTNRRDTIVEKAHETLADNIIHRALDAWLERTLEQEE